jgi:hypothetical protein
MIRPVPANRFLVALTILLLGNSLVSCSAEPVTLAASEPLERIVLRPPDETLLYARPGLKLSDIVSTEPFVERGLRPGMSVTQVVRLLGQPDFLTHDRDGRDQVFGFESASGAFEVVKQHVSSEGAEVDRWFLRYRPKNCEALVDPRLLDQVRNLEPFPDEVTLFAGPDREQVAVLGFDDERTCTTIWWLRDGAQ